jgi:hypothetical protein
MHEDAERIPPAGTDGDLVWLAGIPEALFPENPARAELLRSAISACEVATRLRARAGGRPGSGRAVRAGGGLMAGAGRCDGIGAVC